MGIESTIVDARASYPVVLRLGALAVEELVAAVGPGDRPARQLRAAGGTGYVGRALRAAYPVAGGGGGRGADAGRRGPAGVSGLSEGPAAGYAAVEVLSPTGDVTEAAARLFDALHRLDAAGVSEILAEPVPDRGIGRAINDRLNRAAATWSPPPPSL